jgi:hypothetical protein
MTICVTLSKVNEESTVSYSGRKQLYKNFPTFLIPLNFSQGVSPPVKQGMLALKDGVKPYGPLMLCI